MALRRIGKVGLPPHPTGGYDHADVHLRSGKVYLAHTANGSVEVIDGERLAHRTTIAGCPEASGVLCAQEEGLVFSAARGAGRILVVETNTDLVVKEIHAGLRPNGLAWDPVRKHLLVADVEDNHARLLDFESGKITGSIALKGRPRWCLFDRSQDVFLVNIRDPSAIAVIAANSMEERAFIKVSAQGPHGLELVEETGQAFIACDAKVVVALSIPEGKETGRVGLSGEPDVLWLNSQGNQLYCAIGNPGVIDVIDSNKLATMERLATEEGAHTLTFDRVRQRLYSFLPRSQCLSAYSTS